MFAELQSGEFCSLELQIGAERTLRVHGEFAATRLPIPAFLRFVRACDCRKRLPPLRHSRPCAQSPNRVAAIWEFGRDFHPIFSPQQTRPSCQTLSQFNARTTPAGGRCDPSRDLSEHQPSAGDVERTDDAFSAKLCRRTRPRS